MGTSEFSFCRGSSETTNCQQVKTDPVLRRYWMGYLHLCRELQCRTEAFSAICHLDDISLLEEHDGIKSNNVHVGANRTDLKIHVEFSLERRK